MSRLDEATVSRGQSSTLVKYLHVHLHSTIDTSATAFRTTPRVVLAARSTLGNIGGVTSDNIKAFTAMRAHAVSAGPQ